MDEPNFLEKLQTSPEPQKRRWLVIFSAVAMLVVIAVWLKFFNIFLMNSAPPQNEIPPQNVPSQVSDFHPLQTFNNGAAYLADNFKAALRGLAQILSAPRSFIVKPPQ